MRAEAGGQRQGQYEGGLDEQAALQHANAPGHADVPPPFFMSSRELDHGTSNNKIWLELDFRFNLKCPGAVVPAPILQNKAKRTRRGAFYRLEPIFSK